MPKAGITKFTVVIPTRERCDTLESTLRTCVTQDYDNCEILVSDNFSQDRTREVVEAFKDSRIRYVNTGQRLCMTNNYEFALSNVKDGYVIIIGDDDGLLPGALADLNEIINNTGCEVINWEKAFYGWPSAIQEQHRNLLTIPLRKSVNIRRSAAMIDDVLAFRRPYTDLPVLYNLSAVNYSVIQRASAESGRFYHSLNPDVYSGFAIASAVDKYCFSTRPYALAGTSHNSIGNSYASTNDKGKQARKFLEENSIPFHDSLVLAPDAPIYVTEAFLQARDHISSAAGFKADITAMIYAAAKEAIPFAPQIYDQCAEALREIGRRNGLSADVEKALKCNKNAPKTLGRPAAGRSLLTHCVFLDCSEFGVSNVYEASLLFKHVLSMNETGCLSFKSALGSTLSQIRRGILRKFGH